MSVPGGKTSVFPPDSPGAEVSLRPAVGPRPPWLSVESGLQETFRSYSLRIRTNRGACFFLCLSLGTGVSLCLCGACCSPRQGPGVQPHGPRAGLALPPAPRLLLLRPQCLGRSGNGVRHPHRPVHGARTPFCPTLTAAASAGLGFRYLASSWRRP